ncbi:MFS transporter [Pilimelia anulata]|uniref:MFS transporter n=1 Tax=Pilimelia anulata TaxID=53371 RepID=A0A8J3BES6_9ACTN|nr:MFS transporter [Pilimelia anulata]GGK08579.1 MFS transporter [Pilimelia anulata]
MTAAGWADRRERVGWYFYDVANSAFYTSVVTVFLGPYLTAVAKSAAGCPESGCAGRTVSLAGVPVAPESLFPYMASLSVLLTVFVLPVVGAVADRTAYKKWLMAGCAYVGAAATVGMLFLTGDRYVLGAVLFVVANVAFGSSVVVYYSFLPQLAGPDDRDAVSSVGWAFGFGGGGVLLALNLAAVVLAPRWWGVSTGDVARWCIVSAGVWWAAFTTVPLVRLRNRPPVAGPASGPLLVAGFRQLWATLRSLRAYPLTLFFLIAYLVYNDGIQTVIAMASVYGVEELKLSQDVLVPTILMVQFLALGGALGMGWLARRIGAWKTILLSLVLWSVTVVAAFWLPVGAAGPFVALGGAIGVVLGGSQALSRSLFSQLIPPGREGEYFGLYEISDKGTSWLGPLLFGLAIQATGSYRVALLSLMSFFVIGFGLLAAVPVRRAIVAAGNTPPRVL